MAVIAPSATATATAMLAALTFAIAFAALTATAPLRRARSPSKPWHFWQQ